MNKDNREITLMIKSNDYDIAQDKLNEIKGYCDSENICFEKIGNRFGVCYDFKIYGRTNDYKKLKEKFSDIELTSFAELGNKYDMSKIDFDKWTSILNKLYIEYVSPDTLFDEFFKLIMKVEKVEFLEDISQYTMQEKYSDILKERINYKKGLKSSWENYNEQLLVKQELLNKLKKVKSGEIELTNDDIDKLICFIKK